MNASTKTAPAYPENNDDIVDIGTILRVLWRGKYLVLSAVLLCIAIGAVYVFSLATPKYRATSVLLLDTSGQKIVDLSVVLPSFGGDSEAIRTEVEVLKSRRLIERVVQVANLLDDPEFNTTLHPDGVIDGILGAFGRTKGSYDQRALVTLATDNVLKAMSVRNTPNTYVLEVTMETGSAAKSAHLADVIAEQYILHQMDVKFEITRDASEWLANRVADLKLDLEHAEARVAEYSANSEVVSALSVQSLDRQLKELRLRLDLARETLTSQRDERSRLQSLTTAPDETKAQQTGDARLTQLFEQGGASAAFEARFLTVLNRAEAQQTRGEAQVGALETSIATLEKQISTQSQQLVQLQQLTRDAEANRVLYEYFLGRLKETSAQEGIQQPDSRILSNAVIPLKPTTPRTRLVLIMSLMVGLLLGSAIVLLRELMQNTFRQPSELEQDTGMSVLGQVPLLPAKARREALQYLADKPTSAAAEAIRNLRTSLLLSNMDAPPQVIVTTSSIPGEGKTTLSMALAQNFAGMGKKVLLIEGDIRRLIFAEYLSATKGGGLMAVLSDEVPLKDAVYASSLLGADILVSEQTTTNPADILSSDRFKRLLTEARDSYDIIIVDTPPVLVVPDARVVAQSADGVLFAVHWDKTSRSQVKDALRMFTSVNAPISGLVLNQVDSAAMKRYGLSETYGAYGAYGGKYYQN